MDEDEQNQLPAEEEGDGLGEGGERAKLFFLDIFCFQINFRLSINFKPNIHLKCFFPSLIFIIYAWRERIIRTNFRGLFSLLCEEVHLGISL